MMMDIRITIDDQGKLDVDVVGQPPLLAVVGTIEAAKIMMLTGDLQPSTEPQAEELEQEDVQ